MKTKKQEIDGSANAKVRVPFFVRGVDPELLRGVCGGDDELDLRREADRKLESANS